MWQRYNSAYCGNNDNDNDDDDVVGKKTGEQVRPRQQHNCHHFFETLKNPIDFHFIS